MYKRPVAGVQLRVLEDDAGAPLGGAVLGVSRDPDARAGDGELHSIHVEPAVAGRGFGHALLEDAHGRLAAAGFAAATLWVFERNEHAWRFYERHGWALDDRPGDPWRWSWARSVRLRREL